MQDVVVTEEMLQREPSDIGEFMQLNRVIERYSQSAAGLEFFLEGLIRFENDESIDRAVSVLRQWLLVRFDAVAESMYSRLTQVLFNAVAASPRYARDAGFRLAVSYLRAFLVGNLYPERWPGFWSDCMKMPVDDFVQFLDTFTNTVDQSQFPVARATTVLNAMLVDGSQEAIFVFVLNKAKDEQRFMRLLQSITKWIDQAFTLTTEMFDLLVSKLRTECCTAVSTFTSILSRPIGTDVLVEVLGGCGLAARLTANVHVYNIDDLRACSVFIQKVVCRVIKLPIATEFVPVAMFLLSVPDSAIVTNVKQYFVMLLSTYPDIDRRPILATVLGTIAKAIQEPSEGTCIVLERCFHILSRIRSGDGSGFTAHLLTLASRVNIRESVSEAAALLVALRDFLRQKKVPENVDVSVLVSMFESLLKEDKELTNSHLVALGALSAILRDKLGDTSSDFVKCLFVACSRGLVASINAESVAITDLEDTVSHIVDNFLPVLIEIPDLPVMISGFLDSDSNALAASASKILASMDAKSRLDVYPKAIAKLPGHELRFILKFIKYMNLEGCDAIAQSLAELLNSMKPDACKDHEMMVHFLRTCFRCLRVHAFGLVADIVPKRATLDVVTVLAHTAPYFATVAPQSPELEKIAHYLMDSTLSCLAETVLCEDYMAATHERESGFAADAVIEFVMTLFEKLSPEMKARVCDFMAKCICALPDVKNFDSVLAFISEMQVENIKAFAVQLKPGLRRILADLSRRVTNRRKQQLEDLVRLLSKSPDLDFVRFLPESCTPDCAAQFMALIETGPTPQKTTEFLRVFRRK